MTGTGAIRRRDGRLRLRVLLVTQYFPPELGAAQTRLWETAIGLVERGCRVTVVAPPPSYPMGIVPPGYAWWRPVIEQFENVRVIRLPSLVVPGASISRRIVGQATFAGAALATVALAGRHDVALVESPPLLLAGPARSLRLAGLPYVFHVADPWPDFPIAMGYLASPTARRLAFALEDAAYRGAAAITTVSPGLVELLDGKPSANGRVRHLPNGVDTRRFQPDADAHAARARLGWSDVPTVVYVGTVGLAQGIGTLLDAARLVRSNVAIRIVGDGVERASLIDRSNRLGIANVEFQPPVPPAAVPELLAAADAGLVVLRAGPLFDHSLPTKLLETMAAGRPVIVSAGGLAARIVADAGAGYVAPAEDAEALARAIDDCVADRDRPTRGAAARRVAIEDYDRAMILDRLTDLLHAAARR